MDPYKLDGYWLCEDSLFLPQEKTLVIADLHLGHEQHLRARGHNIQYEQGMRMLQLLEQLLAQTGATRLVINGDLKHEFGTINSQERRDILHLLRTLQTKVEIIVIKGNHDTMTKPLTDIAGVQLIDSYTLGTTHIVHGDTIPKTDAETIVIGHIHPAITLHDGIRSEKYKCFLVGTYITHRLIVLPSFSHMTEGVDVLTTASNSPLLKDFADCDVYVLSDTIQHFGTVQHIEKMLERA